jgi:hypothetical protein
MEKNKVQKAWRNELEKIIKGENEYAYYSISKGSVIRTLSGKDIKPHTLIIFLKIDEKMIIKGLYNGKAIDLLKEDSEDSEDDEKIEIIINEKDEKDFKMHIKIDEDIQLYSKKLNDDKHHRIIIFQENRFFSEIINYDSKLNMLPSRIIFSDKNEVLLIKNLGLSMLCQNVNSLYSML